MKESEDLEDPRVTTGVSVEERHRLISEAAYYRAERRGFVGGYELQDWLDSEAQIDEWVRENAAVKAQGA